MASKTGVETYQLTQAETPVKSHTHPITDVAHGHPGSSGSAVLSQDGGAANNFGVGDNTGGGGTGSVSVSIANANSGITVTQAGADAAATAHQNMQPTLFLNVMIKL
jgi:microcystin-dependent protein